MLADFEIVSARYLGQVIRLDANQASALPTELKRLVTAYALASFRLLSEMLKSQKLRLNAMLLLSILQKPALRVFTKL
jgi:hypothetical protein